MEFELLIEYLNQYGYKQIKLINKASNNTKIKIKAEKDKKVFYLKLIKKKFYFKNNIIKNLINNEIEIGKKLKNKSIYFVNFIEYFFIKKYLVIVYEYVSDCIYLLFQNRSLTNEQIIYLVKGIYNCIKILKRLGFNHINLTEKNIFISYNKLKISGYKYMKYSKIKLMNEEEYFYLMKNNKNWINFSPELILNKFICNKSFLWNIGVLLYKFCKKENPIKENNFNEIYNIYQNKNYKFNFVGVFYKISLLINKCLKINYLDRINGIDFLNFIDKLNLKNKNLDYNISEISKNFNTLNSKKKISLISIRNIDNNFKKNSIKNKSNFKTINRYNKKTSIFELINRNNNISINNNSYSFNPKRNKDNSFRQEIFKIKIFRNNLIKKKKKTIRINKKLI